MWQETLEEECVCFFCLIGPAQVYVQSLIKCRAYSNPHCHCCITLCSFQSASTSSKLGSSSECSARMKVCPKLFSRGLATVSTGFGVLSFFLKSVFRLLELISPTYLSWKIFFSWSKIIVKPPSSTGIKLTTSLAVTTDFESRIVSVLKSWRALFTLK